MAIFKDKKRYPALLISLYDIIESIDIKMLDLTKERDCQIFERVITEPETRFLCLTNEGNSEFAPYNPPQLELCFFIEIPEYDTKVAARIIIQCGDFVLLDEKFIGLLATKNPAAVKKFLKTCSNKYDDEAAVIERCKTFSDELKLLLEL